MTNDTSFQIPTDQLRQRAEEAVIGETANRSFRGHVGLARAFWKGAGKAEMWEMRVRELMKMLSGEAHAIVEAHTVKPRQLPGFAYDPSGWSYNARLGFLDPNGISRPETTARRAGVPVDAMMARAAGSQQ